MAVHLYGVPSNWAVRAIADVYAIPILEDSAGG
jgi:dTDP-4-amino-4,6-dideoxygalactose transaminase